MYLTDEVLVLKEGEDLATRLNYWASQGGEIVSVILLQDYGSMYEYLLVVKLPQ